MNRKQFEGAIVFMNLFVDPAISIDIINDKYSLKLTEETSKEDALLAYSCKNNLVFKEENKTKTLEEFEKQEVLDLTEYLGNKPVEIDEQLYFHILCGYVPCNCAIKMKEHQHVGQGGEAEDSFKENPWDKEIYTYLTVKSFPDNTFWYLGILPDLNRED